MSFKLLKTILEFSLVYKIFEKENKEKKNVVIPERALQAVHPPAPALKPFWYQSCAGALLDWPARESPTRIIYSVTGAQTVLSI